MDMEALGRKLGLAEDKVSIRKAEELKRLSNVHFDSSTFGVVWQLKQSSQAHCIACFLRYILYISGNGALIPWFCWQGEVYKSVLCFELATTKWISKSFLIRALFSSDKCQTRFYTQLAFIFCSDFSIHINRSIRSSLPGIACGFLISYCTERSEVLGLGWAWYFLHTILFV